MTECNKFREQLSASVDGELGADKRRQLDEHLKECGQCREALDDLRKAVGHLQSLEPVDTPPWLTQKIMARIKAEAVATEGKGFFKNIFQPLYIKVPIGAIATLLLGVTTYFLFQSIIPDMKVEHPKQSLEKLSEEAPTRQQPQAIAIPQKKAEVREHVVADKDEGKAVQPETAQKKAEDHMSGAPVPAAESKLSKAVPAASRERSYPETENATKAKKERFAQESGAGAHDKSVSGPAQVSPLPQVGLLTAEKAPVLFHLGADDPVTVGKHVVDDLTELGGKGIKTEVVGNGKTVSAELSVVRLAVLFDRLKKIGPVQEKQIPSYAEVTSVQLKIEILPMAQPPARSKD